MECGFTWPHSSRTQASQGLDWRAEQSTHLHSVFTGFASRRIQGLSSIQRDGVKADRKQNCPGPRTETRGNMSPVSPLSFRQDGPQQ